MGVNQDTGSLRRDLNDNHAVITFLYDYLTRGKHKEKDDNIPDISIINMMKHMNFKRSLLFRRLANLITFG